MNQMDYEREVEGMKHVTEVATPLWLGFCAASTLEIVTDALVNSELIAASTGLTAGAVAFAGFRKFAKYINSSE
jgi:hypothetical protein